MPVESCTMAVAYLSSLRLSGLRLVRGSFEEVLDHFLQRADIHLLAYISVVDETILCIASLLQLHAQINVPKHDLLQDLQEGAKWGDLKPLYRLWRFCSQQTARQSPTRQSLKQ